MLVGLCSLKLRIYESASLKDKRHIIKSIIGRLRARYNISIAEVDLNDSWQTALLGLAYVSNNTVQINKTIAKIINFIENDTRVELVDYSIEIV